MPKAIKKRRTACQPALWKKFSPEEKRWWKMFYRDFLGELKAEGIPGARLLHAAKQATAHNHACLAVWGMRGVIRRRDLKTAGKP